MNKKVIKKLIVPITALSLTIGSLSGAVVTKAAVSYTNTAFDITKSWKTDTNSIKKSDSNTKAKISIASGVITSTCHVVTVVVRANNPTVAVTDGLTFTANGWSKVKYMSGKAIQDKKYCLRAKVVATSASSSSRLKYIITP